MPILESTTTFRFAEKMLPKLAEALVAMRTKRAASFREIEDVFGDPVNLAQNYIDPYCQQFNPADFDDESRSLVREHLTSRVEHFLGGPDTTKHRHLLVLADSGMGKTSCLMMLKLAELGSFWPKPYKVHLFKLGAHTADQISKLDHKKTVLLLDALDEDELARGRVTSRLTELLTATQKFLRVIITCRTQFFSAGDDPFDRRGMTEIGGFTCPVIYLSLFDDAQVNEYLNRKFSGNNQLIARALPILQQMRSLKFRPMLLTHIDDLMESQVSEWTPLSVYEALISAWLHRERRKMSAQRKPDDVPSLADLIRACEVLAKIMFFNGETKISPSEIENAITFNSNIGDISELDITGRSLLNKNSQGDFRFAHYSVQEYLFSRAIVTNQLGVARARQFSPTAQVFEFVHHAALKMAEHNRQNINFKSMNLDGLKLADLNFTDFDFRNLKFDTLDFVRIHAVRTDFSSCLISGLSIKDSWMTQSRFNETQIGSGKIAKSDLSNTLLINTRLDNCRLREVSLVQAELRSTKFHNTTLEKCDFSNALLTEASMTKTTLSSCKLDGLKILETRFLECHLFDTSLASCDDLAGSLFQKCDLTRSVISNRSAAPLRFLNCQHIQTNFSGQRLTGIQFEKCQFDECTFDDAALQEGKFEGCDFSRSILPTGIDYSRILSACRLPETKN